MVLSSKIEVWQGECANLKNHQTTINNYTKTLQICEKVYANFMLGKVMEKTPENHQTWSPKGSQEQTKIH